MLNDEIEKTDDKKHNNIGNEGYRNFVHSIFEIARKVFELDRRISKFVKPQEEWIGCMNKYDCDGKYLAHEFIYERNERRFSFKLPIFTDMLNEINLTSELKPAEHEEPSQKKKYIMSKFTKLLYKPVLITVQSIIVVINAINILPLYKLGIIIPAILGGSIPLYLHVIMLFSSIAYFIPILNQKINSNLKKIVDQAFVDIENKQYKNASDKLYKLSLINELVIFGQLPYFTIQNEIKANFYYGRALLGKYGFATIFSDLESCLNDAYRYTENLELKFKILFDLLNIEEDRLTYREKEYEVYQTTKSSELYRKDRIICENFIIACKRDIKKLIKKFPKCPNIHREKCEDFVSKLKVSVNNLISEDKKAILTGFKQFRDLKLEGYYKYFLPEATIVYKQAYLLCTYIGIIPSYVGELCFVQDLMQNLQNYIYKYYPIKYDEYTKYLDEFNEIYKNIRFAYESKIINKPPMYYSKNMAESFPNILGIELIDESSSLLTEDNVDNESQDKNSNYRNSLSIA